MFCSGLRSFTMAADINRISKWNQVTILLGIVAYNRSVAPFALKDPGNGVVSFAFTVALNLIDFKQFKKTLKLPPRGLTSR
jgi:hypothetical protein